MSTDIRLPWQPLALPPLLPFVAIGALAIADMFGVPMNIHGWAGLIGGLSFLSAFPIAIVAGVLSFLRFRHLVRSPAHRSIGNTLPALFAATFTVGAIAFIVMASTK
jgi:hypothetical protein